LPDYVLRRPTGFYRDLNPTTKLVLSLAVAAVAFGVRGWTGPLATLAIVLAITAVTRLGRELRPYVLATIPLVISILLVNTFFYPGATDPIVTLGPVSATWTGLAQALQATLRVVAFALSVALLALTTGTDDLLDDLEHRGLGRRTIFVIGSAIRTVPRMIERAGEIVDAQRARGLDTEGSVWRRIRGVVPLAGPMVLSALAEVEERTMALEARAFSAPGHRTTLRPQADRGVERILRWGMAMGAAILVALSIAGRFPLP
jgi:energy-coupling factor transport system permease protein